MKMMNKIGLQFFLAFVINVVIAFEVKKDK